MATRVADHLGASGGTVARNNPRPGKIWIRAGRLGPDLDRLRVRYYASNPCKRETGAMKGRDCLLLVGTVVPFCQTRRAAFRADILQPQEIGA